MNQQEKVLHLEGITCCGKCAWWQECDFGTVGCEHPDAPRGPPPNGDYADDDKMPSWCPLKPKSILNKTIENVIDARYDASNAARVKKELLEGKLTVQVSFTSTGIWNDDDKAVLKEGTNGG